MESEKEESGKLVESIAIIDLEQKWLTSLDLTTEPPKDPRNLHKYFQLTPGLYLLCHACEKNRPPIFEVDFVHRPSLPWIPLKTPSTVTDRLAGFTLCIRTSPSTPSQQPLTDIDVVLAQRKRPGDEKEVVNLPAGYKPVTNNPISHTYLITKTMKSLLEQTFKPILLERYPEQSPAINHQMIPIFCFPDGIHLSKELKGFITFNFALTNENGDRFYATCLAFKQQLTQNLQSKLNLDSSERLYYEKAICVLSRWRYTDEFSQCIQHLYRLSMSKNDMPFHKVVANFVDRLVLPKDFGTNGVSYSYGGSNINFTTNPSYPIISERAIYCVFKFLPVQAIVSVFEAILLQKQIIFVSQSKTVLGYAIEAFLSFVFPFKWEHVLIPILPSTLKQYLTAPVPFVVGIDPEMLDADIQSDAIIIQLDTATILNDEDLPPLPDKLEKQLRRRLETLEIYDEEDVKEYLQNPESTYIFKMQQVEHPEFEGHLVRDSFYEFILTLLKNYRKFWKTIKYKEMKENSSMMLTEPQLLNDIFKVQDFLSDLGMVKVGSFGYKFTEGTIFTAFIERHSHLSEDSELLFLDESLDRKKAKKEAKLIEHMANMRYIVAEHPAPEPVKGVYSYERFPSIIERAPVRQEAIDLQLDQIDNEEQESLQLMLDEQWDMNHALFGEAGADDIDEQIEGLLLKSFRKEYEHLKENLRESSKQSKTEAFHSSMSGFSSIKNSKDHYQKLKLFERLFWEQEQYVQKLLSSWPEVAPSDLVQKIPKKEYYKMLKEGGQTQKGVLYCVMEEGMNRSASPHFIILLRDNIKISLLGESRQGRPRGERATSSQRNLRNHYEVYLQHPQMRSFVNHKIISHHHYLFQFMLQMIQKHTCGRWSLQTVIEWRDALDSEIQ